MRVMDEKRNRISVTVRTFNEEKNIRNCLESLSWADELVVVDSGSTDNTVSIAREFTDRVIVQEWLGHIGQSQFATDLASNLWVLHMDADERISPALRDEIAALDLDVSPYDAYEMPRRHFFMQRWIDHSAWYPDYKIRLFRKDRCRWGGYAPHDEVKVKGPKTNYGTISCISSTGISRILPRQKMHTHRSRQRTTLRTDEKRVSSILRCGLSMLFCIAILSGWALPTASRALQYRSWKPMPCS